MAQRAPTARRLRRGLLAATLALFTLALAPGRYATAETPGAQGAAATATLRPALIVVPEQDGQSVLVLAGGVGQLGGQVFTNLRVGPTGNKGSYTMTYSTTIASYVTSVPGFAPAQTESAGLSITTTQGLDTGELTLTRGPLGPDDGELVTEDGGLSLRISNPATFSSAVYVAATPSYAPPGSPPNGRRLAGRAYSLRASGANLLADKPMTLRLAYSPGSLTADEEASLAIYAWDANAGRWDAVASAVFPSQGYVSAAVRRFTFYALMSAAAYKTYMPAVGR